MIDFTRKGARCSAKQVIRGPAGTVGPPAQGTIAYEFEDLGRQLILVRWDTGVSTHVFPDEIEISDSGESTESCKSTLEPLI
jgi:hypothetical protein